MKLTCISDSNNSNDTDSKERRLFQLKVLSSMFLSGIVELATALSGIYLKDPLVWPPLPTERSYLLAN